MRAVCLGTTFSRTLTLGPPSVTLGGFMSSKPRAADTQTSARPLARNTSAPDLTPSAARTSSRRRAPRSATSALRAYSPAILLAAALVGIWSWISHSGVLPSVFLPTPIAVLRRLWLGLTQGQLATYAWVTLSEALLGCLLAMIVALPLAWGLYRSPWFSRLATPYVAASQAIPAIALAPLLVLWIGYGTLPIVLLCTLMVFFPITVTVLLGLRGQERDVLDAARLDGASSLRMVLSIEGPMALPAILSGLRAGFTLSVTGAVVGEMTMGGTGLGQVLAYQRDAVDTAGLFSTIALLCLMAATFYIVLAAIEHHSPTVAAVRSTSLG